MTTHIAAVQSEPRDRRELSPLGVFISYSSENESLARKLAEHLQNLRDDIELDVFISSQMGGVVWRKEIFKRLKTARVLILCYTSDSMKLDWCTYELGMFQAQGNNASVCLMNTNLGAPPSQVEEWQAYKADKDNLRRFFVDFFQRGLFTGEVPVNRRLAEEYYRKRLDDAVEEVAGEFARFRMREQTYPYRITIEPPAERAFSPLDFRTARVTGEERALAIFKANNNIAWEELKELCRTMQADWPELVEAAAARPDTLTRPFPAFAVSDNEAYLPTVTKVQSLDKNAPWKIHVFFASVPASAVTPLDQFRMPDRWKKLIGMVRVGLSFRWKTLEPLDSRIRREDALPQEWMQAALAVNAHAQQGARELERMGVGDAASFNDLFDAGLVDPVMEGAAVYYDSVKKLETAVASGDRELAVDAVAGMRKVNASFLLATIEQLKRCVELVDKQQRTVVRPRTPGAESPQVRALAAAKT
jgi:hypothetical protein